MQNKYSQKLIFLACAAAACSSAQTYSIQTLGPLGFVVGQNADNISIRQSFRVALDHGASSLGTMLGTAWFATDSQVIGIGPQHTVVSVIGTVRQGFSGDNGPANLAQLNGPRGLAVTASGDLYISDNQNFRIRKVHNGIITTIAGGHYIPQGRGDNGPAIAADIFPAGLFLDSAENLYAVDTDRIRRIDAISGIITTVAGGGSPGYYADGAFATSVQLNPSSVILDLSGNMYIADQRGVLVVNVTSHIITTLAGAGVPLIASSPWAATFGEPVDLAIDNPNGRLWVSTSTGLYCITNQLRHISKAPDSTLPGFYNAAVGRGIAIDGGGTVLATSYLNGRAFRFTPDAGNPAGATIGGTWSPFAGNGFDAYTPGGLNAANSQGRLCALTYDSDGSLYFADTDRHIRKADRAGIVTTIAGAGDTGTAGDGGLALNATFTSPCQMKADGHGGLFIADGSAIRRIDLTTGIIYLATQIPNHGNVQQLATDRAGNLFFTDYVNSVVRRLDAVTGNLSVVAGDGIADETGDGGPATSAAVSPAGIAVDAGGNLFISSGRNIRRVDASSGRITAFAGADAPHTDGMPALQTGLAPLSLAVDGRGNLLFLDVFSGIPASKIRRIGPAGIVDSIAGNSFDVSSNSGDGGPATLAGIGAALQLASSPTGEIAFLQSISGAVDSYYARILTPQALPFLTASIQSKADGAAPGNRVWNFNINDTGPGVSLNPRITNITETLTGPGPVIFALQTPTPLGTAIQPGSSTAFPLNLYFPVTTPVTRISLALTMTDDSGQLYTVTLNNLFR